MTKSVGANAVEPRAVETDEFEDMPNAQLAQLVKALAAREVKKLGDERKAAGQRWRHVILRYIGAVPTRYPTGACTARDFHRPERLRCDGQHVLISHQEMVFPGELIEQWAGHDASLADYVVVQEAE